MIIHLKSKELFHIFCSHMTFVVDDECISRKYEMTVPFALLIHFFSLPLFVPPSPLSTPLPTPSPYLFRRSRALGDKSSSDVFRCVTKTKLPKNEEEKSQFQSGREITRLRSNEPSTTDKSDAEKRRKTFYLKGSRSIVFKYFPLYSLF